MRSTQEEARSFIATQSAELAKLAIDAKLDALAFILKMAMHEAELRTAETTKAKARKAA